MKSSSTESYQPLKVKALRYFETSRNTLTERHILDGLNPQFSTGETSNLTLSRKFAAFDTFRYK